MSNKLVGAWLLSTSAGLFGLITYGGYTRLKRAGLSMVDWRPHSISRPKDEGEWEVEFERYKTFPEFSNSTPDMTLQEFRDIYNIEWTHRVWARGMGAYFGIPMAIFWWKGALTPCLKKHCLGMLALGALQGGVGWWMVKSGLESPPEEGRVRVNQLRLATHQITGMGLYSWVFAVGLRCFQQAPEQLMTSAPLLQNSLWLRRRGMFILHLTYITLFSGGLVAGSDAGKILGNWPWFGKDWFYPSEAFDRAPWYRNLYENTALIQFDHRLLGYLTFAAVADTWWTMRSIELLTASRLSVHFMMGTACLQVLLGITALYRGCPLAESLSHQANGMAFLTSSLALLAFTRKPSAAFIKTLLNK